MLVPASIDDYRELARRRLPRQIFDMVDGGAYEETTLRANRADLAALRLRQRVLVDVSRRETSVNVLGRRLSLPVILAPIGLAGLAGRRAEVQGARAAERAGVPFCMSTLSICSLEEVRRTTSAPFWFQLYMMRDRGCVRELLQRAQAAGCDALILTVDLAVLGARYRDVRNGLAGGLSLAGKLALAWESLRHFGWMREVAIDGRPLSFGNLIGIAPGAQTIDEVKKWVDTQFDPTVTWQDLEWIRQHWPGPLIIKGILATEDAREAAERGADAIVVSNHGGRQLDSAPSTISMLPRIVEAVAGRVEVLLDGGIRSGQDVLKAMALGAHACLIGRAWVYGMAARGEPGIDDILRIIRRELDIAMALTGTTSLAQINRETLE